VAKKKKKANVKKETIQEVMKGKNTTEKVNVGEVGPTKKTKITQNRHVGSHTGRLRGEPLTKDG